MNLLNKPIESFNFQGVVNFCGEGNAEGVQLDYKKDLTTGSLSKHFAAFSNTRGGVIIIGVEEDEISGMPTKFEGVPENAQDIERITQWANNVEPLPKWKFYPTNVVSGKRFILIRIYEGDDTPYYVQNQGSIWIRTENISKELTEIASPDYARILFRKKEEAGDARRFYLDRAESVVRAKLNASNREKAPDEYNGAPRPRDYFGNARGMLTTWIQPNFPQGEIAFPSEIDSRVREYHSSGHNFDEFPMDPLEAIPEGASFYSHKLDRISYISQQLYSQGLIYQKSCVLEEGPSMANAFFVDYLLSKAYVVLISSQSFYKLFGYQGTLVGKLSLENANGLEAIEFMNSTFRNIKTVLLSYYSWDFNTDTNVLFDTDKLLELVVELARRIYWDIGFKDFDEETLKASFINTRLISS